MREWYTFNTTDNRVPDAPIPTPADNSSVKSAFFLLRVLVTDSDDHTMNVSFYWPDGTLMGTSLNVTNNSHANLSIAVIPGATYRWFVIVNDSIAATRGPAIGNWTFTVKEEEPEEEEEEEEEEPDEEKEERYPYLLILLLLIGIAIVFIISGLLAFITYEGAIGPILIIIGMIILAIFFWFTGVIAAILDFIAFLYSSILNTSIYSLVFIAVVVIVIVIASLLYFRRE